MKPGTPSRTVSYSRGILDSRFNKFLPHGAKNASDSTDDFHEIALAGTGLDRAHPGGRLLAVELDAARYADGLPVFPTVARIHFGR
jgi:hypothetical protein